MSDESTIQRLKHFGYTALQFGFHSPGGTPFGSISPQTVSPVCRHLQRQACHSFLGRLIKNGHCRTVPLAGRSRLPPPLEDDLQTIGHPDLRFRRPHGLDYVKTKLLSLDFVLQNPGNTYLTTEQKKLDYFTHAQRAVVRSAGQSVSVTKGKD